MALNFPTNPSLNDTYTYQGTTYVWDGEKWDGSQPFIMNTANIVDGAVTTDKIADGAVTEDKISLVGGSVVGYQQGDWIATLTRGVNNSNNIPIWTRVGNTVTLYSRIGPSVTADGSAIVITGFPYVPIQNYARNQSFAGSVMVSHTNTNIAWSAFIGTEGTGNLTFYAASTSTGYLQLTYNNISTGVNIISVVSYLTDDTTWTPINGATVS